MFTTKHFIWIAICVVLITFGTILANRLHWNRKQVSLAMCTVCGSSELCKMLTHMIPSELGGMALNPEALPFHLCSLMLFAILYITFAAESPQKQTVIDFLVPMGLLGGIAAILIPTDGVEFNDPLPYQGFIYHAALIWYSLYWICTGQVNLTKKAYGRNILILLGIAGLDMYVNGALHAYSTNFLFLVRPPLEGLPILNLNHGWYCYFVAIMGLALSIITLFYLPFLCKERKCKV